MATIVEATCGKVAAPAAAGPESGCQAGPGPCSCGGAEAAAWDRVADVIVKVCARVQEGEVVQLGGGVHAFPLLQALALAVRRAGAFPELNVTSQELLVRTVTETPLEYLARPPRHRVGWIQDIDAVIATDSLLDPGFSPALSKERQAALAAGWDPLQDAVARGDVRSVYVPFPTAHLAAKYGLACSQLQQTLWASLDIDYGALSRKGQQLARLLQGAREVAVETAAGTDFTLAWDEAYVHVDDGTVSAGAGQAPVELPAGRVMVETLGAVAQGRWAVPRLRWRDREITGAAFEFVKGRLARAKAGSGAGLLQSILAGGRRASLVVGGFAVGLNPALAGLTGYELLDQRATGAVSIMLVDPRPPGEGGPPAPPWQWLLPVAGASLRVDGELVVEEGEWRL